MLNLTGGSPQQPIGYGSDPQNFMDIKHRAVLFVFKPYQNQFGVVGLRPFEYHFDDNFLAMTQEAGDLAKRGNAKKSTIVDQIMARTNLSDNMVTSAVPSLTFNGNYLNDKWRFILVFTEKASGLIGMNTIAANPGNNQVRRIYTGFFEDEPFNPLTFSSNHDDALNQNAYLVITHKTVLGTTTQSTPWGGKTSINTQTSEEVIQTGYAKNLISQPSNQHGGLVLMTPKNCVDSIEVSSEGQTFIAPGSVGDLTREQGNDMVHDFLERPDQNVKRIVGGLVDFQERVAARGYLHTNRNDSYFDDVFMDKSSDRLMLGQCVDIPRSGKISVFDLDTDSRISPVTLNQMVNNDLQIVPIDIPRPTMYDTADHLETSLTNQYSYLIAAVVAPILNSAGLTFMHFVYQVAMVGGEVQQHFQTVKAHPNWTLPPNETMAVAKAVEMELRYGIFDTIFKSMGAFHVMVHANVTGSTLVKLSLVDQGYRATADFEMPTSLGGLISPLIGNHLQMSTNANAIEGLYNLTTGTQRVADNLTEQDYGFMNGLNLLS